VMLLIALVPCAAVQAQDRMPPIPADKMTDAQKKAVADYKAIRGTDLTAPPWTVLLRVTLPLLKTSLVAGAVLCWARALGEFGATITFAGNFPGRTQTLPLAVYVALETRPEAAFLLSLVLLLVSLLVLVALRRRWLWIS